MTWILVAAMLGGILGATPVITMTVDPHVATAPATITIRVRIALDDANEYTVVECSSAETFRSSLQPTRRDSSQLNPIVYAGLPGGTYTILAVLYRTKGIEAVEAGRAQDLVIVTGDR